jgi:putative MFS transporter
MSQGSAENVEATRLDGYLVFLFFLLSTATLFDGFDNAMFGFAAPDVRATLGISREQWGLVSGMTRTGVIVSFFFLLMADRWGRRTLLMVTVVGFTVFNTMTAFVTTTTEFVLCQFFARIFLTAEYSLAIIVIGEEYPARLRGRAIAILTSLATVGVMAMSKIQPYVLLSEGEESNWLHTVGIGMVTAVQAVFGLDADGASWRGLYVLSAFPLVLVLFLRIGMRETRRFSAVQSDVEAGTVQEGGFAAQLRKMSEPWTPRYRRRTAIVALLWNCVHLVTAPSVVYWVIFAREDLGLTTNEVGDIVFWGYGGGVLGHFVAGDLIDRIGRKWTCAGFYVAAACSIYFLYHTPTVAGQYLWMFCTVFSFGAAITATHVYASELFPTEIRATGYGWTTNLAGRVTDVLTPMAIGLLIVPLGGIPAAISVVAAGPILGALLVLRYAPETKGMTLEEVQRHLDDDADFK